MNDERFQVNFSHMPSVIFFIDAFEQRYTLTHLPTWFETSEHHNPKRRKVTKEICSCEKKIHCQDHFINS
jgi:hypothetical protein